MPAPFRVRGGDAGAGCRGEVLLPEEETTSGWALHFPFSSLSLESLLSTPRHKKRKKKKKRNP